MKEFLKRIDSELSIKLVGNTIGLYPNILGLRGRSKLMLTNNQNSKDVLKKGYLEFSEALDEITIDLLKNSLDLLESEEDRITLSENISVNQKDLNLYRNDATLKILNGDILLDLVSPGCTKSLQAKIDSFFSVKTEICNIMIWRNYFTKDVTLFSGDWHYDRRPAHWFRLFILLEDVGINQGPFMFISKEESREVTRKGFKRQDMNWQSTMNSDENMKRVHQFIGKKGLGIVVDTQNLLHRAGVAVPGRTRDMLQVVFKIN